MNYEIEHKKKNTSGKIFYVKKAHYAMDRVSGGLEYKFRGTSQEENPTYLGIAKSVLGLTSTRQEPIKGDYYGGEVPFVVKKTRLNSLHDFEVSLKKSGLKENEGKKDIVLFPGKTHQEEIVFRFTDNELPYKSEKEYINRKKSIYQKDYAELVKQIGFEEAFHIRLKNYNISHQEY
jgi:hypothetical protein